MYRAAISRALAGGAVLLALSVLLHAQAQERVAYVSVFDSDSRAPASGLGPEAFVVREDGVSREVLRVTPATSELPVAVLYDNSAAARDTITDLRRALSAFVTYMAGTGPIALVSVADRPTIHVDYTTDTKALADGAGRIFAVPGSGATLLDSLVEVSRGLARRESDRAAIVVVTTERIEFSQLHFQQVLDPLHETGASVYEVVLQNPRGSADSEEARNRASVLDRAPRETGGIRFDVLTSQAYERQLTELAAILKAQYRVVYAAPDSLIPPDHVEVEVKTAGLEAHGAPARGSSRSGGDLR